MIILDKNTLIHIFRFIKYEFDLINLISIFPEIELGLWKKKCVDKFLLNNDIKYDSSKFNFLKKNEKSYYNSLINLPTKIFFPVIDSYKFIEIKDKVFYFTGNFEGGNRCVRGNIPYLLYDKPVCSFINIKNNFTLVPILVYYYEIFIIESEESWKKECISVGICCDEFPLIGRQVGWDKYSYGLHSDDGKMYFNESSKNFTSPFKYNNYIGCGLIFNGQNYDLFYTKNGNFLGYAIKNITGKRFYPVIGIDCKNKIKINFGLQKFKFDLMRMNNLAIENYKIQNNLKKLNINRVISFNEKDCQNKYRILNIFLIRYSSQIKNITCKDYEKILLNIILSIKDYNLSNFNLLSSNIPLLNFLGGPIHLYNIEELITADSDDEMNQYLEINFP